MAGPQSDILLLPSQVHRSFPRAWILYFKKTCILLKVWGCSQPSFSFSSKFCSVWWICFTACGWTFSLFHWRCSFCFFIFLFLLLVVVVDFKSSKKCNFTWLLPREISCGIIVEQLPCTDNNIELSKTPRKDDYVSFSLFSNINNAVMTVLGYLFRCPHSHVKGLGESLREDERLPKIKNLGLVALRMQVQRWDPISKPSSLPQACISVCPRKDPSHCLFSRIHCLLLQLCILVDLAPVLRGISCKRISVLLFLRVTQKDLDMSWLRGLNGPSGDTGASGTRSDQREVSGSLGHDMSAEGLPKPILQCPLERELWESGLFIRPRYLDFRKWRINSLGAFTPKWQITEYLAGTQGWL